jgi:hypothetical protein
VSEHLRSTAPRSTIDPRPTIEKPAPDDPPKRDSARRKRYNHSMRARQILTHLRKQPFAAIRIHLSDGSHYDVTHPEMAAVSQLELVVGIEPVEDGVPYSFAYCDPLHVTRIEPLNGQKSKRTRAKRRRPGENDK